MSRQYRVGLVGCGDIAETGHVPALLKHPRFALTALCDVRAERTALLSRQAGGVATYSEYHELLKRGAIDAVILALHPEVSVNVAIDYLRAGIPVLDEKPLARNLADGQRLAREVAETHGVYQIGFVFRYSPLVHALAGYAKEIGTPACYHISVYDERNDPVNNKEHYARIQQILRNSSAITHEGSHPIDYMSCLNSAAFERISASAIKTHSEFNGPNIWNARLELADGSMFVLDIGWFIPELPASTIAITGPNGTITVDSHTGAAILQRNGQRESLKLAPLSQNWAGQLDAFAESIDRGEAKVATVHDGLRALQATIDCENSARSSQD